MFAKLKNLFGEEHYRAITIVTIGGVIGGIGAVLLTFLRPDPSSQPGWALQACKIGAGPIAALIAVLFIMNTDRRDTIRLLVLSIIMGLSGPSILVGAVNIGLRLVDEQPLDWNYTGGNLVTQKP